MKSLAFRFLLLFGLVAILFSAFVLYRAHTVSQRHVRELLNQQMALAMEFNLAIRDYAGGQIRPAMERLVGKDKFHPETMSTSFISRRIFEQVQKNFPDCIIRFASDDPRNPINKASPDEHQVIEYFRQNPGAAPRVQEIQIEGRRYLAHFTPRWMKAECLRCHGEPQDAPAAMLARYGDTASFHRKVGEIMALDTVAVPLDKMNAALAAETRWQSLILAVGLALLFGAVMVVFRFVVTRRLAAMASHFNEIAAQPESARLVPLSVGVKDEIGLVGIAFNRLVDHLRDAQTLLERRVQQRTADLAAANEELRREIAERQRAEHSLRESEAQARQSARLMEGLFDAIPDVIGVQDSQRRILRYNSAGYRFLGLKPEEARGKICYQLIGRVKPCEVCATAECLATKRPAQVEKYVSEAGIWLECRSYPVLDEQGGIAHVIEHLRDITERKQSEAAIRQRGEDLAHLLEVSKTLAITLDLKAVLQAGVDGASRLLGLGSAAIYLREGEWLHLLATTPPLPPQMPEPFRRALLADHPCIQEALTTGRPVLLPDTATAELTPAERTIIEARGLRTLVFLPLVAGEQTLGTLIVGAVGEPRPVSEAQIDLGRTLANLVALAVVNSRLYEAGQHHVTDLEREVAERKRAEAASRENEERYRVLFEGITDMVFVHGITEDGLPGQFLAVNDAACRRLGYRRDELLRLTIRDIDAPESTVDVKAIIARLKRGEKGLFEQTHLTKDGQRLPVEISVQSFQLQGGLVVLSVVRDITERKRAEEEREKLQSQLTQAQKMESVGRLAGGVAHDFNNMLQVISGNVSLALLDLPAESPVRDSLLEVQKSAQRSADLTRQLLAFARKQTIAPKVLDLNDTVAGMLKMLRRLIGEDIDLSWMPGANLWPVKMDPSQIDQVLANLCVNARDAIGGVGAVTIETTNVTLDDTYVQNHPECVPGDYVMLAVSDTGKGMDAETQSHLFEPFFTTKEQGKGTGLGLATVFGIVKQNLGLISVYSEPGQGTAFKIYLPRAEAQEIAAAAVAHKKDLRGTETILLVEDEDQILALAQRILQQHGYTVLAARSPEAALKLAEQHAGRIHLLITDVVMPGMNGRELRRQLVALQPELRCLYMSGYTANVIAHHGVLDEGVQFLQKPFTIESLAEQVREALKQPLEA